MENITKLLSKIDDQLSSETLNSFNDDFTDEEFNKFIALTNIEVTSDLIKLLKWKNGQKWNSILSPDNNRRLMSMNEIIETIKFYNDPMSEYLEPWEKCWVPILTNDSSDYVVYVSDGSNKGKLIGYWHNDYDRKVEYNSICDWALELIKDLSIVA
ncbi:SMI1/KNR4 family protein [Motilimonas pumila]|uniref:Knr4/Smi1-like domain-containing protein n=1 Tax=Motilimonas pumila TaxID=2303987 RepID=A0A418Y8Y3_9GAMM|nr:SMI1/KNR4 family protein [Motilimonas pumila]RJG35783.1 hypothetical protein D1Z90_20785 [Motilimonas pumila]